jgi:hypothetical protein
MSDPLVEPDVGHRQHERQDAEEKDAKGGDAQRHSLTTVVSVWARRTWRLTVRRGVRSPWSSASSGSRRRPCPSPARMTSLRRPGDPRIPPHPAVEAHAAETTARVRQDLPLNAPVRQDLPLNAPVRYRLDPKRQSSTPIRSARRAAPILYSDSPAACRSPGHATARRHRPSRACPAPVSGYRSWTASSARSGCAGIGCRCRSGPRRCRPACCGRRRCATRRCRWG